jgi:hypothetical protein
MPDPEYIDGHDAELGVKAEDVIPDDAQADEGGAYDG